MDGDLFGDPGDASAAGAAANAPLAERLRPRTLDEVIGQRHLLAPGKPLRAAFDAGRLHSMILWGPPGVGKTTLARLVAQAFDAEFIQISAVLGGGPGFDATPWWLRLGSLVPLALLLAGLMLIDSRYTRSQIDAAAEVDAAILADDLPPEAYRDQGFVEFLRTARP